MKLPELFYFRSMKSKTKFNEGDKVEWNAGYNSNISVLTNKPVGDMWREYDFGYYSATEGKAVLYEVGCRNMQDSICVDIDKIRLKN